MATECVAAGGLRFDRVNLVLVSQRTLAVTLLLVASVSLKEASPETWSA